MDTGRLIPWIGPALEEEADPRVGFLMPDGACFNTCGVGHHPRRPESRCGALQ